jgi:acetyl esterase/lipase
MRHRLDWYRQPVPGVHPTVLFFPPARHRILMGHSAGAQIGALPTLNAALLFDPARIGGFIGLAGPYDFYPFTEDAHWELFGPEPAYPASQPVNFVRADAPPLFLLHGADDRRVRRGHSKSLMEKQQAAGGRAERRVYPGLGHVELVLAFSRLHRRGSPVVRDVAAFIASLGADAGAPPLDPTGSGTSPLQRSSSCPHQPTGSNESRAV